MANTYYLGTSDLSQFPKCGIDCFGGFITDLPCKGIEDVKCVCIEENKFALKVKEVDIKKCWEKNCDGRTFVGEYILPRSQNIHHDYWLHSLQKKGAKNNTKFAQC